MAASPMRRLSKRPRLYWADKTFIWPGLYTWIGRRHIRLLPMPATSWARLRDTQLSIDESAA